MRISAGMKLQHIVTKTTGTAVGEPYRRGRNAGASEYEYVEVKVQCEAGFSRRIWRTDSVREEDPHAKHGSH